MIIGLLNRKGGVGKTTVAVNLAATVAIAGGRVLLVDADPQGSSLAWASARDRDPLFAVIGMAKPTLHRDLPALARRYDLVVIDGAPAVDDLGRAAVLASDLILIPVQPSPYDVWASGQTVQLVREAREFRSQIRAAFLINRCIAHTSIGRHLKGALAQFHDIAIFPAALGQRVIYAESAARGLAAIEVAPGSEAAREMGYLAREVLGNMESRAA
jgi:chromosome partitioning protein